ncbi:MAG: nitroreductase [Candidatus Marithrix sp.]|nr:nitroreductase [Candidatus Marithrix sp.]
MTVTEALKLRKSTRAFLNKSVDIKIIQRVLDAAKHSPSGVNTQPWQVAVVSGDKKIEIEQAMENAFNSGVKGKMDYQYYPNEWQEPYKNRRKVCGLQLYSTLKIAREDKAKQKQQWLANYRAFDAPVVLFFFMDKVMNTGSFLDYGMFLQSIMLAAVEEDLAICPQAALAEYPQIIKEKLGYSDDCILICGMAFGYEDQSAVVNSYRTAREEVDSFTKFFE